jgi:DNA-binding NarL/FixJ family response regulator
MHRDPVYVREMLRAGAKGYLVKDADDDALLDAVRAVARGEAYLGSAPGPADGEAESAQYRRPGAVRHPQRLHQLGLTEWCNGCSPVSAT